MGLSETVQAIREVSTFACDLCCLIIRAAFSFDEFFGCVAVFVDRARELAARKVVSAADHLVFLADVLENVLAAGGAPIVALVPRSDDLCGGEAVVPIRNVVYRVSVV